MMVVTKHRRSSRWLAIMLAVAMMLGLLTVIPPAKAANSSFADAVAAAVGSTSNNLVFSIDLTGNKDIIGDVNINDLTSKYPNLAQVKLDGTNVTRVIGANNAAGIPVETTNTHTFDSNEKNFQHNNTVIEYRESEGDLTVAKLLNTVKIAGGLSDLENIPAGMFNNGTVTINGTSYAVAQNGVISGAAVAANPAGSYTVGLSFPVKDSTRTMNLSVTLKIMKASALITPAEQTVYDGGTIEYTFTRTDENGNQLALGNDESDYRVELFVNANSYLVQRVTMSADKKQLKITVKAEDLSSTNTSTSAMLQVYEVAGGALLAEAKVIKATNEVLSSISLKEAFYDQNRDIVVADSVSDGDVLYIAGGTSISSKTLTNVTNNVYTDTTMYLLVDHLNRYVPARYMGQVKVLIGNDPSTSAPYDLAGEPIPVDDPNGGSEQVLAVRVTAQDVTGQVYSYDSAFPDSWPVSVELRNDDVPANYKYARVNAQSIANDATGYKIYQVPASYAGYSRTDIEDAIRNEDANVALTAWYEKDSSNVWQEKDLPGAVIPENYTIYLVATAYYQDGGQQFIVPGNAIQGWYYDATTPANKFDDTGSTRVGQSGVPTSIDAIIDNGANFSSGTVVLALTTLGYEEELQPEKDGTLIFAPTGGANNVTVPITKAREKVVQYLLVPEGYTRPTGSTYAQALQAEIDAFYSNGTIGTLYQLNVLGEDTIAIGGSNSYQIIAIYSNDRELSAGSSASVAGNVTFTSSVSPVPVSGDTSTHGESWFTAKAAANGGTADALVGETVDMTYSDGTLSSNTVKLTIENSTVTGLYLVFEDDLDNCYSTAEALYSNFSDINALTSNFEIPLNTFAKVYAVYAFSNTGFYNGASDWAPYIALSSDVTLDYPSANLDDTSGDLEGILQSTDNQVKATLTVSSVTVGGVTYAVSAPAESGITKVDVVAPMLTGIYAYDDALPSPQPIPNGSTLTGRSVGYSWDTNPTVRLSGGTAHSVTGSVIFLGDVEMIADPAGNAGVKAGATDYTLQFNKSGPVGVSYLYTYILNGVQETVTLQDGLSSAPTGLDYIFTVDVDKATVEEIFLVAKDNSTLTWNAAGNWPTENLYTLPYTVGSTFCVYPVALDSSAYLDSSYQPGEDVTKDTVAQKSYLNYMHQDDFTIPGNTTAWILYNYSGKLVPTWGVDTAGYIYCEFTVTGEIPDTAKVDIELPVSSVILDPASAVYSGISTAATDAEATVYHLPDAASAYVVDIMPSDPSAGTYFAGDQIPVRVQYSLSVSASSTSGNTVLANYFDTDTLRVLPGTEIGTGSGGGLTYDATAPNALRVELLSGPTGAVWGEEYMEYDLSTKNINFVPTVAGDYVFKLYTYNSADVLTPNFAPYYRTVSFTVNPAQTSQTVYYGQAAVIDALVNLPGVVSVTEVGTSNLDAAALGNGAFQMTSNADGSAIVEARDAQGNILVEINVTLVGATVRSVALSETTTVSAPKAMDKGASGALVWNVTYEPSNGDPVYTISESITSWTQGYTDDSALALNLSGNMITAAAGTVSGRVGYLADYDGTTQEVFWAYIDANAVAPAYNYVITDSATDMSAVVGSLDLLVGSSATLYVWDADAGALVSGLALIYSDNTVTAQGTANGADAFDVRGISLGNTKITVYPATGGSVSVDVAVKDVIASTYNVTGNVDDGTNPIAGATVTVSDGTNSYTATTDANGDFTVPGVLDGAYTVTVTASGYVNATAPVTVSGGDEDVGTITMTPAPGTAYNVTGNVDDGTNPIAGATVTVSDGTNSYTATTDANGDFTVPGVPDGTYTVTVSAPGYVNATAPVTVNGADEDVGTITMTQTPGTGYTVTVNAGSNGSASADKATANAGETVTVTVTPDSGYVVDSVTAEDAGAAPVSVTAESDGTYTFTMPGSDATVTVTFKTEPVHVCPSAPYTDVDTTLWYHEYIDYVIEHNIMTGTGNNLFEPTTDLSRGMMVQIFYNMEGRPAGTGGSTFRDVNPGDWYLDAVVWAAENDIVDGYGDGLYGPNDSITREQMVVILYRYADYNGYDVSATTDISGYGDANSVSSWAYDAMAWAVAEGLVDGRGGQLLSPTVTAMRSEVAAVMTRYCILYSIY